MTANANPDHRLERLTFFSDAVFAISITLLVLEIRVSDDLAFASNARWLAELQGLFWHLSAFVLSFLVIGAMWVAHHLLFALVTHFDRRILWPNLLLLFAVAIIPFTTTLLAKGSLSPVPYVVYAASLLAAGLLKARLTRLVLAPDLVAAGVSPARIALELRRRWVFPAAALASLLLAFVFPAWNNLAMLGLPIGLRLPGLRYGPGDS